MLPSLPTTTPILLTTTAMIVLLLHLPLPTTSHGFLSTPRSRNLVAYQDRVYYPLTENDPLPEDCPNCLNRGGVLARCGVVNYSGGSGSGNNETGGGLGGERNYDLPKNALGGAMHANPQATYVEASTVEMEVTLTAHHRGHFEFKACPVESTSEAPEQECFDRYPLMFVSDELCERR